jgi:alkyl sulfatase BDS1-like metallo-beta-lactamase superfamily hydrolase
VLQEVEPPPELIGKPYLRPVYDEPEFIVRNLWRLYGGWYEGDPSRLKPAPAAELARELADLTGGPERLAGRATELAADGRLRLAGHLAELAALAAPGSSEAHEAREQVNARRADEASSTMARGIFSWAAAESRRALEQRRSGEAPL